MYPDTDTLTMTEAPEFTNAPAKAPQFSIEQKMASIVTLGNYEAALLFSEEGLPIAQAISHAGPETNADRIAEMAITLQEVSRMAATVGGISRLREVAIEGDNHRRIVFRFFRAFEQAVVLAVVVPPGKPYKQKTNELEKLILGESF
ncbi:MAG: roadblock/LC7 domain-containing protein [candidate division KSB1 bacterium]|nr:roadblock/LC7 domain-containing protein [candidate division KSB1 bacterium]MDZ7273615.1 roadblock/LC7 domain-containing protein [candidate division KSB1 bacterium]MDZ7286794.1 roadblock/LC7 domain-containing protein [candidate division KSB1 bacterium]MDZ7299849.1 roadblock/LC7 domain-containing protein [candidate division KSB1 bacterium]MDZ7307762.1 roadblock/LC7 domain-containing protein [candidate division KSB1 bacterium]